jgi:hypothetical protein
MRPIKQFPGADEDLFWVAATQRASAAKRKFIDDGNAPSGLANPVCGARACIARSDDG